MRTQRGAVRPVAVAMLGMLPAVVRQMNCTPEDGVT
jgi:hypothetical protein